MNKLRLIIIFFSIFLLSACLSKSIEKYNFDNSSKIPQDFLVAVTISQNYIHVIPFEEYQKDQASSKSKFTLFLPPSQLHTNACGRTKFKCTITPSQSNTYEVEYRGLLGEGSVSKYHVEGNKIIPISFSCTEGFCKDQ